MRFAWREYSLIVILSTTAAAVAQTNPHTQIRWPPNCNNNNYMAYNYAANTCIHVGPVGASGQVQFNSTGAWGVDAGFTYDPVAHLLTAPNLAVPGTANVHIPPSGIAWPPTCSSGVYVPASNTCVAPGTAANPGGSPTQLQFNAGGTFQGAAGSVVDGSGNVTVTSVKSLISPTADVTAYGAFGDGVHDDGPAFRAARTALTTAGGGTLFIPKGTFMLSTPDADAGSIVNIQANHIHVVCGPGAILTSTSSLYTLFRLGQITSSMHGLQNKAGYQANTLPVPGSAVITLTTPANTANFAVGDPIYILGGPSIEANGDGEINWITAINAGTGALTLRKPTSKPYTGNASNVGAPGIVTVMDGAGEFFTDLSIENCTATPAADFAYIGQVIGAKLLNNRVVVNPTATRGMMANSFYPMADIEIAGNSYTEGGGTYASGTNTTPGSVLIQLADGWRDVYIHDNDFSSPYGPSILNISQGVVNTIISHNSFYHVIPALWSSGNTATMMFSTAYQVIVNDNVFFSQILPTGAAFSAISTGLSNGSCLDCTFSNNIIRMTGNNGGSAILIAGTPSVVTGNEINVTNTRFGISTSSHTGVSYSQTIITNNRVFMTQTPANAIGINAGATATDGTNQGQAIVDNNLVQGAPGALGTGIVFNAPGGGDMSHNSVYNLPTGFSTTIGAVTGTPQIIGNVCIGVTNINGCGAGSPTAFVPVVGGGFISLCGTAAGTTFNCIGDNIANLTGSVAGLVNAGSLSPGAPNMLRATSDATAAHSAGWLGSRAYITSQNPIFKTVIAYAGTTDYTSNSRIQVGLMDTSCTQATLVASDAPTCSYAMIWRSTVRGDTDYQCQTDNGSGAPTVTTIPTTAPVSVAPVAMSVTLNGTASVSCSVGVSSVTVSTTVPTFRQFNAFVGASFPGGGVTHIASEGWTSIAGNGQW